MTTFTVKIAQISVEISAIYPSTKAFCRDYLCEETPRLRIAMTQADIEAERENVRHEEQVEQLPARNFRDSELERTAVYRKLVHALLPYDIVLFHGAAVVKDGEAYLFTAPSGTGKTTHVRLWLKNIPGTYVLNGDKPLLQCTPAGITVCGTPWQGKENYGCNELAPLKGLCILTRDTVNHIEPVTFHEAMPTLFQQAYRPTTAEEMRQTLTLLGRFSTVGLYRLGCNMDDEAAFVSFRGMQGG